MPSGLGVLAEHPAALPSSLRRRIVVTGGRGSVVVVSIDDEGDELVANYVSLVKGDMTDARDMTEYTQAMHESGALRMREVDLRDVAGHNHLGAHAHAREKHLKL